MTQNPTAGRLRALADGMQAEIDRKLGDRLTNTPKRMREAGNARNEGRHLERTQTALRALATMHEAGPIIPELAKITSKAAALPLVRTIITHNGGYYTPGYDTGKPADTSPAARALWALIGRRSEAEQKADAIRQQIAALQFASIPGYFPTPPELVARMIEAAKLPQGPCTILEPSAGSGNIVDGIRQAAPAARVVACEKWHSLRAILQAKGVELIGDDFTETTPPPVDRVLMNPPFENGQDAEHVRRAHGFLKPGGLLVAIMSPGPFFRSDRKSAEFRDWFASLYGERVDIPAGAFKASGTGIATVMITLTREATQ